MKKTASVESRKLRPAGAGSVAKTPAVEPAGNIEAAPARNRVTTPVAQENHRPNSEVHSVTFEYDRPAAHEVLVAGTFNDWQPSANPMIPQGNGKWSTTIRLKPGHHEYRFVVDGHWLNDPLAEILVANPFGGLNCVVEVKLDTQLRTSHPAAANHP